jgi:hypothetical protein
MAEPLEPFSVIVPVYNGAETLGECLTEIVNQECPKDRFEVIVVDDGSTDASAAIASTFPVRLIRLPGNRGRIEARNRGAREARFETLVFNDVRVLPERRLLEAIRERGYEPAIPETRDYDGSPLGFSRFFYLLRCRIYAPHYPEPSRREDLWITSENFDRVPKGTTCFVCSRGRWLASQPERADRYTSDDTRILRAIVAGKPILRTAAATVRYRQRTDFATVMSHTFERGPRFADYYLRPGGRYFALYAGIWACLLLALPLAVAAPGMAAGAAVAVLATYAGAVAYLSRTWRDVLVVGVCLPAVAAAFGLGILKWQLRQLMGKG